MRHICWGGVRELLFCNFFRLQVNNRVAVKRCSDGTLHMYINGEDLGVAATNVPKVCLLKHRTAVSVCIRYKGLKN